MLWNPFVAEGKLPSRQSDRESRLKKINIFNLLEVAGFAKKMRNDRKERNGMWN